MPIFAGPPIYICRPLQLMPFRVTGTQHYKLARYAGADWKILSAYLEGKDKILGEFDG